MKLNDRLYVAAAGNDGQQTRQYPAAHEYVLGVSGIWWDWKTGARTWYGDDAGFGASNFMPNETYPVSGVYGIDPFDSMWDYSSDYDEDPANTAITPLLPGYSQYIPKEDRSYDWFGGTSAATPQIAALAFHLYSRYPALGQKDYTQVRQRIVGSRGGSVGPVKGQANYHLAIQGW